MEASSSSDRSKDDRTDGNPTACLNFSLSSALGDEHLTPCRLSITAIPHVGLI
jgi:hypothetical protein